MGTRQAVREDHHVVREDHQAEDHSTMGPCQAVREVVVRGDVEDQGDELRKGALLW